MTVTRDTVALLDRLLDALDARKPGDDLDLLCAVASIQCRIVRRRLEVDAGLPPRALPGVENPSSELFPHRD